MFKKRLFNVNIALSDGFAPLFRLTSSQRKELDRTGSLSSPRRATAQHPARPAIKKTLSGHRHRRVATRFMMISIFEEAESPTAQSAEQPLPPVTPAGGTTRSMVRVITTPGPQITLAGIAALSAPGSLEPVPVLTQRPSRWPVHLR